MQDTQTITISRTIAEELDRVARESGKDRETLLQELVEQLTAARKTGGHRWGEAIKIQDKIKATAVSGGIVEFIRRMRESRYGR